MIFFLATMAAIFAALFIYDRKEKKLPGVFTLPRLQAFYESILEAHFDRRNFGAKMLKLGILDEVGERPKNAGPSIPVNYRFNKEKYEEMKAKGFRLEF